MLTDPLSPVSIELSAVFDFVPSVSISRSYYVQAAQDRRLVMGDALPHGQAERQADKMAEYDGYDGFSCAPW